MQLLPRIRTSFGSQIGVGVYVSHPDLDTASTFIVTDVSAGVTTLTVDNGLKFSDAEYIVIGDFGNE